MSWSGKLKTALDRAETTGPKSVSPYDLLIAAAARVRDANNRQVMAEAEMERSRIEYEDARFSLARLMKDYGIMGLVDGKLPPPDEDDGHVHE